MQVIVNNIQISYNDSGSGKTIVFLHGWRDSKETFESLVNQLSKNFRCVALDLPNFGASQQTMDIISLQDYASIISNFLKKLEIKHYVLVGHSMGGQIAVYGVGQKTLTPQKLILVASAGIRNKGTLAKSLIKYATKPFKKLVSKNLKNKLYKKVGSDYQASLSPIHKKIISSVLRDDVQTDAKKVDISTLLIYGENDQHTPAAIGQRFHDLIQDSELVIINNQDHWLHQKAAAEVAAKIEKFV